MQIRVDIDRTLCTYKRVDGRKVAVPNEAVIARIQKLYDEGHNIIIWTSRGRLGHRNFKDNTERQMKAWKVPYHAIDYDKPIFDMFIDDKVINVFHWMEGWDMPDGGEDY